MASACILFIVMIRGKWTREVVCHDAYCGTVTGHIGVPIRYDVEH